MTGRPERVRRAEEWLDQTAEPEGGGPANLDGPPTRGELREQQIRETGGARTGVPLTTPAVSAAQSHGMAGGAIVGGIIGAVLALPLGLVELGEIPIALRLLIAAIVGAVAGSTVGAVYAGGRMPELEKEAVDATGEPQIGTTPRDPHTDDKGR